LFSVTHGRGLQMSEACQLMFYHLTPGIATAENIHSDK